MYQVWTVVLPMGYNIGYVYDIRYTALLVSFTDIIFYEFSENRKIKTP